MGSSWWIPLSLLLSTFLFALLQTPASAVRQSYVVYMGSHAHSHSREAASLIQTEKVTNSHHEFLGSFLGSKEKAQNAIFYSYTRFINGFAANLEEEEAMAISMAPEVMAVFPNRGRSLHTTRSWSFLGLERDGRVPADSLWAKARFGEDTIIGNLDTGVWPESASFDDKGMGPVPARWKGRCEGGAHSQHVVRCNRSVSAPSLSLVRSPPPPPPPHGSTNSKAPRLSIEKCLVFGHPHK